MVFRDFFKRRSDMSHAHQKRWSKPGSKFTKINVDASFNTEMIKFRKQWLKIRGRRETIDVFHEDGLQRLHFHLLLLLIVFGAAYINHAHTERETRLMTEQIGNPGKMGMERAAWGFSTYQPWKVLVDVLAGALVYPIGKRLVGPWEGGWESSLVAAARDSR
jgi:hypothetical protein